MKNIPMKTLIRGLSFIALPLILGVFLYKVYDSDMSLEQRETNLRLGEESIFKLNNFIFVDAAVINPDETQSGAVIVYDDQYESIASAQVSITVNYPCGEATTFSIGFTDINGIAYFSLPQHDLQIGQASLTAEITFQNHSGTTSTSFLIWY
ncbi:MAG: hypothetical protein FVQ83_13420 [Chloroflexi bacterium]|nr:hypothetical protein [Chloroflexota bacterium]